MESKSHLREGEAGVEESSLHFRVLEMEMVDHENNLLAIW